VTDQEGQHKLGDVLRAAREARGVDLARVERDTKIRSRYLSALEQGDYRELPGAVYTKGFLRNYGSYLGLDPDYLVDLYRIESSTAIVERPTVHAPPRPIATRRSRAFVITPGALVAALLTVGVVVFAVYLVTEFVTFARTPELRITVPLGDVAGYDELEYTMRGVTEPNSTITVEGAVENPDVVADADGAFEIDVRLVPGSNVITLVARDPLTGRDSDPVTRTIVVGGPEPSPSGGGVLLRVTSPADGATLTGPVEVTGTTAAGAEVTVTAAFVSAAQPTFRIVSLAGQAVPVPATTPAPPEPMTLTADGSGAFSGTLTLAPATWDLTVTPDQAGGGAAAAVTRRVVIGTVAGLSGTLSVSGSASYLEIDQDGRPMANVSGRNAQPGANVPLAAQNELRIRVGNAASVRLVINGIDLGTMGGAGAVVEWRITRL
jgi:transcriptional regulator with XRE-family HTH domain